MAVRGLATPRRILATGAIALVTCNPSGFESLGAAYHSPHFDYLYRPGDPTVCIDVMDSLEQHEQVIANYLGIDPSSVPRVTYFKMRDFTDYQASGAGSEGTGGFAGADFVVSPLPFDEHELIHTITMGAWGMDIPRFVKEGIAVSLSCEPAAVAVSSAPYTGWDSSLDALPDESNPQFMAFNNPVRPIESYYDLDASGMKGYAAAGAVTTYLLDVGGSAKFRQLWSAVHQGSSASEFSSAVQSIYGISLDDVWSALQSSPHRPCAPVWMCSLPPIADSDGGTLWSSCTGKTLGRPTSGNVRLRFPALSSDDYTLLPKGSFSSHNIPVTGISLIACDGNAADMLPRAPETQLRSYQADTWIPPLATPSVVTFESAGWVLQTLQYTYALPDGQIAYQTSPLAPTTTACSAAATNVIPPATASALWMPNDSATHYARFALQDPLDAFDINVYATPDGLPPAGVSVALCAGCAGDVATDCNGCPPGTPECIVAFTNASPAPTWLRIVYPGTLLDAGVAGSD